MEISEAQNKAAGEFVELVAEKMGSGRAIHPETAISSAARLSGALLLRSFEFDIDYPEPGTVLLSEQANEKGPMLIEAMMAFLSKAGVVLDPSLLGGNSTNRGAEPQLPFLQALNLMQEDAQRIRERNGLSLEEAAVAAALATGFVVKECAASIGAETGFNAAAYGFIEGSKTAPPPLARPAPPPGGKPWYKLW